MNCLSVAHRNQDRVDILTYVATKPVRKMNLVFQIHPTIHLFNLHFFRLLFPILRARTAFLSQEHHSNLSAALSEFQQTQLDLPRSTHKVTHDTHLYFLAEQQTPCKAKCCFKKIVQFCRCLTTCSQVSPLSERFPSLWRRQGSSLSRQPYTQVGQ